MSGLYTTQFAAVRHDALELPADERHDLALELLAANTQERMAARRVAEDLDIPAYVRQYNARHAAPHEEEEPKALSALQEIARAALLLILGALGCIVVTALVGAFFRAVAR